MVHHFWCVGRNYVEHAKELGNPLPSEPLIFSKSGACLQTGPEIVLSKFCKSVHHELEVVLLLGHKLQITHWTLGLDLTDRVQQTILKKSGSPWELAKSFHGSAVLGPWQKWTGSATLENTPFTLKVNQDLRQVGQMKDMIFKPEFLVNYLQERFPLIENDAIFTGTPSGVGPLQTGDQVIAQCGELTLEWSVR